MTDVTESRNQAGPALLKAVRVIGMRRDASLCSSKPMPGALGLMRPATTGEA